MAKWESATIRCHGMASYSVGSLKVLDGREETVYDKNLVDRCRGVKGLIILDHYSKDDNPQDSEYDNDDLDALMPKQEEKPKRHKLRPKNG